MDGKLLQEKIASSAARSSAFARVTSLAAVVVAATGVADLITGSINLSLLWTCLIIALALLIAAMPMILGRRFPPAAGLAACWIFAAVTSLQVAQASHVLMIVNNLVLYPMVSCYLGWFFRPRVARVTVVGQFVLSGAALMATAHHDVFTTWANLALASLFCLEAALFLRAKLDHQIESDPLTGALNRAGLGTQLARELYRARRGGTALTIAAVDLDRFKEINDLFGHPTGDRTLVDLVAYFKRSLRPHDTVARTGGDEFVVLLPNTSRKSATVIMERLRARSEAAWTFGIATSCPSDTEDSLMRRADEDLYVQKRRSSPA